MGVLNGTWFGEGGVHLFSYHFRGGVRGSKMAGRLHENQRLKSLGRYLGIAKGSRFPRFGHYGIDFQRKCMMAFILDWDHYAKLKYPILEVDGKIWATM